jgi:hypothetical protein
MKSIEEWQKAFKTAADRKFPNNEWDDMRRVQSIQDQLDDVKVALKVERGELQSEDHAHQDADHRIGALIADILILAEQRGVNVENSLKSVLKWFGGRV